MAVELNIEGLDELNRKLQQLANPRKAKSIARKAGRQAMNLVRDAARTNAKAIDDPQTREKIHKNIAVAGGKSRNPNEIIMRVGVKGGASFSNPNPPSLSGGDTRHWRWVEFGSSKTLPYRLCVRRCLKTLIKSQPNLFKYLMLKSPKH